MQINRLEIQNFGSHENSVLDLRNRGLVLIEGENRDQGGSNGSGKSTIFESLCWGLFGATNAGIRGKDVIRVGSSGTSVAVVHSDVDGQRLEVTRTRDGRSSNLDLRIEGNDANGATGRETQERLIRLLQLNWETFVSVVMFPQGQEGIAGRSDGEQKHVLDTILTLSRFVSARERATKLSKDMESELSIIVEKIGRIEAAKAVRAQTIQRLSEQEQEFQAEKVLKTTQLRDDIKAAEKAAPQDVQPLLDHHAGLEQRLDLEKEKGAQALEIYQQLVVKLQQAKGEGSRLTAMIRSTIDRISDIQVPDPDEELAKNDTCPACDQQLPEEARDHLYQTFASQALGLQAKKNALIEEHSNLSARDIESMEQVTALSAAIEEVKERLVDTTELETALYESERKIQAAHLLAHQHSERLQSLRMTLGQATTAQSPYTVLFESTQRGIEEDENTLAELQKAKDPLSTELDYVKFWLAGFGNRGVKSLLMSTVTPFLNERANVYMKQLSNDTANITIKTQTQLRSGEFRDRMDFKVEYPYGSNLYMGKSGGERRRADLSILFALGDLAASRARAPVQLRLLDEPFESLDALGCEQVVRLLRTNVLPRAKTILVMSHNEALKPLFEHRIKVVKENGVSRIEDL